MNSLRQFVFASISHSSWRRTKLFPELRARFKNKVSATAITEQSLPSVVEAPSIPEYLFQQETWVNTHILIIQWTFMVIRYKLYELFEELLELIVVQFREPNEKGQVPVDFFGQIVTKSVYCSQAIWSNIKSFYFPKEGQESKPNVLEMMLTMNDPRSVFAHSTSFQEIETWFGFLANYLYCPKSHYELCYMTQRAYLYCTYQHMDIARFFMNARSQNANEDATLFSSDDAWNLSIDEECQVMVWMFDLIFRQIHMDTLASQLQLIYSYFGLLLVQTDIHEKLRNTLLLLLQKLQLRIIQSGEVLNSPVGVTQSSSSSSSSPSSPSHEQRWQLQIGSEKPEEPLRLKFVLSFVEPTSNSTAVISPERQAQRQRWFHSFRRSLLFTRDDIPVYERCTSRDVVVSNIASTTPPTNPDVFPVLLFSSIEDIAKKALIVSMPRSASIPYCRSVLQNKIGIPISPFEFMTISGTYKKNGFTKILELVMTQYYTRHHIDELILVLHRTFDRLFVPFHWCKHATIHLLDLICRSSYLFESEDLDKLLDTWITWFRYCNFNLNTLNSKQLTDLQISVLKCTKFDSAQKKKAITAMITTMEYNALYMYEPVEMYEFKHLLTLLLFSISNQEVDLIRMYFALLLERFVQLVSMQLYDWMDPFSQLDDDEQTMASVSAAAAAAPISYFFPLFSESGRHCVASVDIPDWREEVNSEPFQAQQEVIFGRRLTKFCNIQHPEFTGFLSDTSCWGFTEHEMQRSQQDLTRQVNNMLRKYKYTTTSVHETLPTIPPYEAETLVYRFMTGMANSNFFRAMLELTKYRPSKGVLYFLKWQPALLNFVRPDEMVHLVNRCEILKSNATTQRDFYTRLIKRFRCSLKNTFECPLGKMSVKFRSIFRCKLRDSQLRALRSFVTMYPSVIELHQITSMQKLQSFFGENRPLFQDASKPVQDCSICFETVDCTKSLAVFTTCGHFYCLSCILRTLFDYDPVGNVDDRGMRILAEGVTAKRKEQCICPFCRMSMNTAQPSLPSCFGNFILFDNQLRGNWTLSSEKARNFMLPVLYLLDYHEVEEYRQRQQATTRRKRKLEN